MDGDHHRCLEPEEVPLTYLVDKSVVLELEGKAREF